jgi:uncharacterized damage-inducible protein DinB
MQSRRIQSHILLLAASLVLLPVPGSAAEPSKVFEASLRDMEREIVPLVEAMPAEKFGFAPTNGSFYGVRTFALQAKHIAFVMYEISAAVLGEKNPSASSPNENGPVDLKTKAEIARYLKDAFAYAHKAVASLTAANLLDETTDPFNPKGKRTRLDSASILLWHSYDHYGQMVEYARMNRVVPPASQPQPKP